MSRWDRRHTYWRRKEVISIWIVGRIALIQDEWVRYRFGWYAKSIPRMLQKQDGKDDIGKGLYWWEVDSDGGCFWSQVKFWKSSFSFGMSVFDVVQTMLFSVSISQYYSSVVVYVILFYVSIAHIYYIQAIQSQVKLLSFRMSGSVVVQTTLFSVPISQL